MNKFITMIAAGFIALSAIAFFSPTAKADDLACKNMTTQQVLDKLSTMQGIEVAELTQGQINALITKNGPPPNSDGVDDISIHIAKLNGMAALFIHQKGCLIFQIGPAPLENVLRFLGAVEA